MKSIVLGGSNLSDSIAVRESSVLPAFLKFLSLSEISVQLIGIHDIAGTILNFNDGDGDYQAMAAISSWPEWIRTLLLILESPVPSDVVEDEEKAREVDASCLLLLDRESPDTARISAIKAICEAGNAHAASLMSSLLTSVGSLSGAVERNMVESLCKYFPSYAKLNLREWIEYVLTRLLTFCLNETDGWLSIVELQFLTSGEPDIFRDLVAAICTRIAEKDGCIDEVMREVSERKEPEQGEDSLFL